MAEIADVVIVGGGIIGIALAYELARRTLRVTLLEAHALGSGVTGSGFAWVNATSKADRDEDYFQLNAASVRLYDEFLRLHHAEPVGINAGGTLLWADTPEQKERLKKQAEQLLAYDYLLSHLDITEMEALEPHIQFRSPTKGEAEGWYCPADKWVEPSRLVRFLADYARRNNADIREYTPVREFSLDTLGNISLIKTDKAQIATRTLIIAAGAQTPALLSLLKPDQTLTQCVPLKRVPGILTDTGNQTAQGLAQRILYPPDRGGLHLRPTSTGGLLIGADDTDALVTEAPLPPARLQEIGRTLLVRASDWLPTLPIADAGRHLSTYICNRPIPQDDRPIVGRLPNISGVFVAVTHSGVTLAPLLASLLAEEIVLKHIPPLLNPYRPNRFLRG